MSPADASSTANPDTGSADTSALPAGMVFAVVTAAGALALARGKPEQNG